MSLQTSPIISLTTETLPEVDSRGEIGLGMDRTSFSLCATSSKLQRTQLSPPPLCAAYEGWSVLFVGGNCHEKWENAPGGYEVHSTVATGC